MKTLLIGLLLSFVTTAYADINFQGNIEDTNTECGLTIDGDYAYIGDIEFRLTKHTIGPFVACAGYSGCISGVETDGPEEKSIFILLDAKNKLVKFEYDAGTSDYTDYYVCENLARK